MAQGKVFVIDDDASVRKALGRLIGAAGYQVEGLASADAYFGRATPDRPACLVLDVSMPSMSGLELQQAIAGTTLALPIIFITGHGAASDVRGQALVSGCVDVLEKPLGEKALMEAIERALDLSVRRDGEVPG
jgi:FixJ family two-component response regulator